MGYLTGGGKGKLASSNKVRFSRPIATSFIAVLVVGCASSPDQNDNGFQRLTSIVTTLINSFRLTLDGLARNGQLLIIIIGLIIILIGLLGGSGALLLKNRTKPKKSYSELIAQLSKNLSLTSKQIEVTILEINQVIQERERALRLLQEQLAILEKEERETRERIEELKNLPNSAVQHLLKTLEPSERASARRDYILFGLGLILGPLIGAVLSLIGFGP